MDTTQKINVVISGDDSKFRAAAKSSEKAVSDLEKKSSSDFKKMASNFAGLFSDKGKDTGIGQFIGEVTEGTSALSSFAGPAAIVTGAVVGIGTAAVGAGAALFSLAKSASDYGSEIADAESKTGLTSESLSALRYQANLSGSDFGQVSGAISKFSKLVGEAGKGSDEAKAKLKALGIDPQEAVKDLDGALGKAFKTINDAKPGVEQTTAATDAFGKSGAELIPTIRGMNGDFAALKKQAESLGIVLKEEDVQASDEFGDTLDTLKMQAQGAANEFAFGFMPKITSAMRIISGDLKNNKDVWREWGEFIGEKLELATRNMNLYIAAAKSLYEYKTIGMSVSLPAWLAQDKENQYINKFKQSISDNTKNTSLKDMLGDIDKLGRKLEIDASAGDSYLDKAGKTAKAKKDKEISLSFDDLLKAMRVGTAGQESGGDHTARNKRTGATGAWQVLPEHIPEWTEKTFGKGGAMSVEQFKANPQAQVAVFNKYMGEYLKEGLAKAGGNWEEGVRRAAVKWYGTKQNTDDFAEMKRFRSDEPSRGEYTASVLKRTKKALGKNAAYDLPLLNGALEIGEGAKALADYDKQVQLLGASTERQRLEVEILGGKYSDLNDLQLAQLRLSVDTIDSFNASSKASDEYSSFVEKLNGEYDSLTDVQKSASVELEFYLAKMEESGVVLDENSAALARNKAAQVDLLNFKKQLEEANQKLLASEKDLTELAAGYQLTDPGTPEGAFAKPQAKEKVGISDYWGAYGDAKAKADEMGVLFDPDSLAVQMDALTEFKDVAIDAFGGIADGLGQVLENWIMTGEMSGQAIAKMTASVIAGVAAQAAVKSIFEVAEGLAALANPFTAWQAPMHFAAAKTYGLVALGATAIGLGIGAAGGLGGKKDKSSSGSADKSPSDYLKENSSDDRKMDFLRQSQNSTVERSNQVLGEKITQFSNAVETFDQKVNSQKTGEVFVAGMKANQGLVSRTVLSDLSKNSTLSGQMGRRLGLN